MTTTDGRVIEKTILNAKGDSANPLSGADLVAKFKGLAAGVLIEEVQKKVIDAVMTLESKEDVSDLVSLL